MKKLLWIIVIAFSLNAFSQSTAVKFLSAKVSSDGLNITMIFNKSIYGTNKGFTIFNTTSTSFSTITGFGTNTLIGVLSSPIVYGNAVNISYKSIETDTVNPISGDLVDEFGKDIPYFLHELADVSDIKFNGTEKYVSADAVGGGDGTKASPFTFAEMFKNIDKYVVTSTTGIRFNVKAGTYTEAKGKAYNKHGIPGKPIIIEGYTAIAGDNPDVGWDYDTNRKMDSSKMPLLDGKGTTDTNPLEFSASSFITVKNFQIRNYGTNNRVGIYFNNSNNIFIDNCIIEKIDRCLMISGGAVTSFNIVVTNSIAINGYRSNININGKHCLSQDNKSYGNSNTNDATDYYYALQGDYNVLRDNYCLRDGNVPHSGHGLSIATSSPSGGIDVPNQDSGVTQYNFIDGHTSVNMAKPVELRHGGVRYNVVRGLVYHSQITGARTAGGIMFRDNASYNIVENCYGYDVSTGFNFTESVEIGVGLGHDNTIRNCIVENSNTIIRGEYYGNQAAKGYNNKFYNCTFQNIVQNVFRIYKVGVNFTTGNSFTNCIFDDTAAKYGFESVVVGAQSQVDIWNFNYNNFFNSWISSLGTNSLNKDPKFVDPLGGDFRLKVESSLKDYNNLLNDVIYDFDGNIRQKGTYGAFEYQDKTTGSINANAGADVAICNGESTILTATGGSAYSWSTGATTKSITVSPDTTTVYTVTVSEGSSSDSDAVTVAVSSVIASAGTDKTITVGESVTLTASGGDSYVWNTGETTQNITVSPASTATYTVTAKKGDCEDTNSVTVTVNAAATVTANAGVDVAICNGENTILTATGGTTYKWSTGATTQSISVSPNTTTTYTVTVSEGNVSDSNSVTVTVNNVTANAGSDQTIYEGENITLTASGGDSYVWSTGATTKSITVSPQETQNYTLTAYNGSCEDTDTVQVTVNKKDTSPPPAKANAGEDQTICLGENIKLTASGGSTYEWSTGETTKSIFVNPTRTTSYSVTATRGGVTNADAVVVTVENCSAISDGTRQEEMTVYPNPTTGTINIKADNDYASLNLNIYSLNGSIIYSDIVKTNNNVATKSVDLSNLSKGVYFVRMYNSDYHKIKKFLLY